MLPTERFRMLPPGSKHNGRQSAANKVHSLCTSHTSGPPFSRAVINHRGRGVRRLGRASQKCPSRTTTSHSFPGSSSAVPTQPYRYMLLRVAWPRAAGPRNKASTFCPLISALVDCVLRTETRTKHIQRHLETAGVERDLILLPRLARPSIISPHSMSVLLATYKRSSGRQWSKSQLPTTAWGQGDDGVDLAVQPLPSPLADSLIPYCSDLRGPKET
ncbi:hypothetical protein J3F83DRAFT_754987 [Trichoderma novae-zelandiae]